MAFPGSRHATVDGGGLAASPADMRLVVAAKNRDEQAVKSLLKNRSQIDVNAADSEGMTALLWAAHWDDLDTAKCLVEMGANAESRQRLRSHHRSP